MECQIYVLRDVSEGAVSTPQKLVEQLQKQFGSLVPSTRQFPVGYMKGSSKVTIRTAADVADIWAYVKKGDQISLWCQGVRSPKVSSVNVEGSDSESDDEGWSKKKIRTKKRKLSALDEKNNRIEDVVSTLQEKHGDRYTTIQYRLWAEMVDIGTHRSGLHFDL